VGKGIPIPHISAVHFQIALTSDHAAAGEVPFSELRWLLTKKRKNLERKKESAVKRKSADMYVGRPKINCTVCRPILSLMLFKAAFNVSGAAMQPKPLVSRTVGLLPDQSNRRFVPNRIPNIQIFLVAKLLTVRIIGCCEAHPMDNSMGFRAVRVAIFL